MGVTTSEVGYTSAMPRREDDEVHKDMWGHWKKKIYIYLLTYKTCPRIFATVLNRCTAEVSTISDINVLLIWYGLQDTKYYFLVEEKHHKNVYHNAST